MAQCKKILENRERCTNRAVPGSEYCSEHKKRIKFRRLPPAEAAGAGEGAKTQSSDRAGGASPDWAAKPFSGGKPSFPGLKLDGRNILAARRGVVLLTESGSENHADGLFERLVRLLSFIGGEISLARHVGVKRDGGADGAGDVFVFIDAPDPEAEHLSRHFDMLSSAAEFCDGFLYIGEDRLFVRYRDENAVSGYDAPDAVAPEGEDVFLVDIDGPRAIFSKSAVDWPLDDLLLRIPPLPEKRSEPAPEMFALTEPALYPMFCRYFGEHELRFRAARFRRSSGKALVLFRIGPRAGSSPETPVPRFVLEYLENTPGCVVLAEDGNEEGARTLVQWRHSFPVRGVSEAFEKDCVLVFSAGPDFFNLRVSPAPAFFDAEAVMGAKAPPSRYAAMSPEEEKAATPPKIPVRLIRDPGPSPFVSALILDNEQTGWLLRLVGKLPGRLFHAYSLCRGRDVSVLLAEEGHIEGVPFGIPLRRVEDSRLFVPAGFRVAPNLPWDFLSRAMNVREGTYAFLTLRSRLDIPTEGFQPLHRALAAEPERPVADFEMVPSRGFPELKWTAPAQATEPERKGLLRKLVERAAPETGKGKGGESDGRSGRDPLEQRANRCREQGDFLSAGVCFSLLDDDLNAARCFKKAVSETGGERIERSWAS